MLVVWVVRNVFDAPRIHALCDSDEEARGVLESLACEDVAYVSVELRETVGGA
jgi:hypothetical protein